MSEQNIISGSVINNAATLTKGQLCVASATVDPTTGFNNASVDAMAAQGNTQEVLMSSGAGVYPVWTPVILTAKKTATTNANSNASLTADAALSITVLQPGWYAFGCYLPVYATSNGYGGFQFDFGANTANIAAMSYGVSGWSNAAVTGIAISANNTAFAAGNVATSASGTSWFYVDGMVNIDVAGTFAMRWAQDHSTANAVNLLAGAYLTMSKI